MIGHSARRKSLSAARGAQEAGRSVAMILRNFADPVRALGACLGEHLPNRSRHFRAAQDMNYFASCLVSYLYGVFQSSVLGRVQRKARNAEVIIVQRDFENDSHGSLQSRFPQIKTQDKMTTAMIQTASRSQLRESMAIFRPAEMSTQRAGRFQEVSRAWEDGEEWMKDPGKTSLPGVVHYGFEAGAARRRIRTKRFDKSP